MIVERLMLVYVSFLVSIGRILIGIATKIDREIDQVATKLFSALEEEGFEDPLLDNDVTSRLSRELVQRLGIHDMQHLLFLCAAHYVDNSQLSLDDLKDGISSVFTAVEENS